MSRRPLWVSFAVSGFDKPTLRRLCGEPGSTLRGVWGKESTVYEIRLRAEELFFAIIDNFHLINRPCALLDVVGERLPWTGRLPNQVVFELIDTLVSARRKYNAVNDQSTKKQSTLLTVIQRFIDLSDGKIKFDPEDDAWKAHAKAPGRMKQQLLAREATKQELERYIEAERNEVLNDDEDELKENADYPDDNDRDDEYTTMHDPDAEYQDVPTSFQPPPNPKPTTSRRFRVRDIDRIIGSRSRVTKERNTHARMTATTRGTARNNRINIFANPFKGAPKFQPFLPITPAPPATPAAPAMPATLPDPKVERVLEGMGEIGLRPKPHPETGVLCEALTRVEVDEETKKKIPPRIPMPKKPRSSMSMFIPRRNGRDRQASALRIRKAKLLLPQQQQLEKDHDDGGDDDQLFVK